MSVDGPVCLDAPAPVGEKSQQHVWWMAGRDTQSASLQTVEGLYDQNHS